MHFPVGDGHFVDSSFFSTTYDAKQIFSARVDVGNYPTVVHELQGLSGGYFYFVAPVDVRNPEFVPLGRGERDNRLPCAFKGIDGHRDGGRNSARRIAGREARDAYSGFQRYRELLGPNVKAFCRDAAHKEAVR